MSQSKDYEKLWDRLKKRVEQDATSSGSMMSLAEWVWTTGEAKDILKVMEELEEE